MNPFYKDYNEYITSLYPDFKVQKISVNAGFSCPNRDGTISRGGCIYCSNDSFTPGYCLSDTDNSVTAQLERGKQFFARKYPNMKYLAYFQSFTNTFAPVSSLKRLYGEAVASPDIVGLVIGTRPDCLPPDAIALLNSISRQIPVFVELGAESSHNATLRTVNRGHDWQTVCRAAECLHEAGIRVGIHLIAGLPGESTGDVLLTVKRTCELPVDSIKMHHLQVLKNTVLARRIEEGSLSVPSYSLDEYIDLCCRIVEIVPGDICIERFLASAPPQSVISPFWGLKNYEFTNLLHNRLAKLHPEH